MKPRTWIVVGLLLAPPASAELFNSKDTFRFSFSEASVVAAGPSQLEVTATGITAPFGIKRSGRPGGFQDREVTVLGEAYDLKDAAGAPWRLWIRRVEGPLLTIELVRHRIAWEFGTQQFRVGEVTVDDHLTDATFGDLTLYADGSYRLGRARGRFSRDEGGVLLDGASARWGRGTYSLDLDAITFRFDLGGSRFAVKYRLDLNLACR